MRKIGLVLAGGGGKGAYHIGVWKALREFGIDKNIHAVSGTSVGALNATLFLQDDLKLAENIWLNITQEKILTPDPRRILRKVSQLIPNLFSSYIRNLSEAIVGHGWFSRAGLEEIFTQNIHFSYISKSTIPCYITCLHARTLQAEYFQLNNRNDQDIRSILLASSAIPFLFDPVEIDGNTYWDGGVPLKHADNVPVKPLYDIGCDLIIVVHLNRSGLIDFDQFQGVKIAEIVPQDSQGGVFTGTLDFSKEGARRRIHQGYQDTYHILKPIVDTAKAQYKQLKSFSQMNKQVNSAENYHSQKMNEAMQIRKKLSGDVK